MSAPVRMLARLFLLLAVVGALSACGAKGALYLPKDDMAQQQR